MSSIYNWSTVAASNGNSDDEINWLEGQPPNTVNDSARVMLKRIRDFVSDVSGAALASGTASTIQVFAASNYTTLANGRIATFRAIAVNGGPATLNVNGINAKPLYKAAGNGVVELDVGDIQTNGIYVAMYSETLNSGTGAWVLINPSVITAKVAIQTAALKTTLADDDVFSFLDTSAGQELSKINFANILSNIQKGGVYSGNVLNNTSYPIGTTLFVNGALVDRNVAISIIRVSATDSQYVTTGPGVSLAGTWRGRGAVGTMGSLVQRTL